MQRVRASIHIPFTVSSASEQSLPSSIHARRPSRSAGPSADWNIRRRRYVEGHDIRRKTWTGVTFRILWHGTFVSMQSKDCSDNMRDYLVSDMPIRCTGIAVAVLAIAHSVLECSGSRDQSYKHSQSADARGSSTRCSDMPPRHCSHRPKTRECSSRVAAAGTSMLARWLALHRNAAVSPTTMEKHSGLKNLIGQCSLC